MRLSRRYIDAAAKGKHDDARKASRACEHTQGTCVSGLSGSLRHQPPKESVQEFVSAHHHAREEHTDEHAAQGTHAPKELQTLHSQTGAVTALFLPHCT